MRPTQRALLAASLLGCERSTPSPSPPASSAERVLLTTPDRERSEGKSSLATRLAGGEPDEAVAYRRALVAALVTEGSLRTARVKDVFLRVPRHVFVPNVPLSLAYADRPLAIGHEQTISQPAVVAVMTEALELSGTETVLEVGTGSGYQAAILGLLARTVCSVEIVPELAATAKERLARLGLDNVHVRAGDGYAGWPERAPFHRILLTAAPPEIPRALLDQLAEGGSLVAPVGAQTEDQRLLRYHKEGGRFSVTDLGGVRFVPMVHAP